MDLKYIIFALFLFNGFPLFVFSQSKSESHSVSLEIPEVALLSLVSENQNRMAITSVSPLEAGNFVSSLKLEQGKIWINYSSIISNKNHRRKIVAKIEGETPAGVRIFVEASESVGEGKGKLGISSGWMPLSNQPAEIISNIGSCYTGKGVNNGHFLTYRLEYDNSSDNYTELADSETSINIIYTLTDSF